MKIEKNISKNLRFCPYQISLVVIVIVNNKKQLLSSLAYFKIHDCTHYLCLKFQNRELWLVLITAYVFTYSLNISHLRTREVIVTLNQRSSIEKRCNFNTVEIGKFKINRDFCFKKRKIKTLFTRIISYPLPIFVQF